MRLSFKEYMREEDISADAAANAKRIEINRKDAEKRIMSSKDDSLTQAMQDLNKSPIRSSELNDKLYQSVKPNTTTPNTTTATAPNTTTATAPNTTKRIPTPAEIERDIKTALLQARADKKSPELIDPNQMQQNKLSGMVQQK